MKPQITTAAGMGAFRQVSTCMRYYATDIWKGGRHPLNELPTRQASPRPWQRMAIMKEVSIILTSKCQWLESPAY